MGEIADKCTENDITSLEDASDKTPLCNLAYKRSEVIDGVKRLSDRLGGLKIYTNPEHDFILIDLR